MKSTVVHVRMSAEEHAVVKDAAGKQTLSAYIRSLLFPEKGVYTTDALAICVRCGESPCICRALEIVAPPSEEVAEAMGVLEKVKDEALVDLVKKSRPKKPVVEVAVNSSKRKRTGFQKSPKCTSSSDKCARIGTASCDPCRQLNAVAPVVPDFD